MWKVKGYLSGEDYRVYKSKHCRDQGRDHKDEGDGQQEGAEHVVLEESGFRDVPCVFSERRDMLDKKV